jgi:hypothetical protein
MFGFLKSLKKNTTDKDQLREKGSKNPWVEIVGEQVDPAKGIKIELDWNDAFVDHLKRNGYTGTTEEAIVQRWLTHLYQHLIESMKDKQTTDFE